MERRVRFHELILGIEGLALLRNSFDGDDQFMNARVEEIRRFAVGPDEKPPAGQMGMRELDAADGYAAWSATYDSLPNSIVQVEQPVVHRLFGQGPAAGVAVDAACGTGRHSAALAAHGYRVIGVDQSDEMLAVARGKVPGAEFRVGRLQRLPLDDDCADLVVCALALTHLADLSAGVDELARVVRPGGRVIISDLHPLLVLLHGQALFAHGPGRLAFVRNHTHLVSDYLAAFAKAGLTVRGCVEPLFNGLLPPGGYEEAVSEAAKAAWRGMPWAIVWELEREVGA
jgi:ubiquinone/menaquinone biosynthesis C-methylase UbiE